MSIELETIAEGSRYRLRSHNQVMTLSAEDCVELMELLYLKRDEFAHRDEIDEETQMHLAMQKSMQERVAQIDRNPYADEPFLEDCPCGSSHLAGTSQWCPLNPQRKPLADVLAAYRAMEAALQLLTGNILNLRTELLVIKAEIMKGDEL